jgi:hypothetical protein
MGTRIICRLIGCVVAEDYPACYRCNTDLYDGDFIQAGWLEPVFRAWRRTRRFVERFSGRRCAVCSRRFWRRGDDWTCSDKCFEDWLPF